MLGDALTDPHPQEDAFVPRTTVMPTITNTPRAGESKAQLAVRARRLNTEAPVLGTQVGGTHYTDCAIQPIEYIWANDLGFSEGNIVKYVTRWKSKGGIKDLRKAHHHLALRIERAEAEEARTGIKYGL